MLAKGHTVCSSVGAELTPPRGLLIDFGGVIFDSDYRAGGLPQLAHRVAEVIHRRGCRAPDVGYIMESVTEGLARYREWIIEETRSRLPREITPDEFWKDFVAANWPHEARTSVSHHGAGLLNDLERWMWVRKPITGIEAILKYASDCGLAVCLVSNTLSGTAFREALDDFALSKYFSATVCSVEVGVRKPNPKMFAIAGAEIGVSLVECVYVGDRYDMDVVGAKRAGVSHIFALVRPGSPFSIDDPRYVPDAQVASHADLLKRLTSLLAKPAVGGSSRESKEGQ